jgi:hypothetical protein
MQFSTPRTERTAISQYHYQVLISAQFSHLTGGYMNKTLDNGATAKKKKKERHKRVPYLQRCAFVPATSDNDTSRIRLVKADSPHPEVENENDPYHSNVIRNG